MLGDWGDFWDYFFNPPHAPWYQGNVWGNILASFILGTVLGIPTVFALWRLVKRHMAKHHDSVVEALWEVVKERLGLEDEDEDIKV